jgi:hypothetical protein
MSQTERDELRQKHYQIGDGYICAYCWFYAGEENGHEQALYPCDAIRVLDALDNINPDLIECSHEIAGWCTSSPKELVGFPYCPMCGRKN